MKVFYISPTGYSTPLFFDTFSFDKTEDINEAAVVFFDFHSGLFDYDWAVINKVIEKKLPVVVFDQFDYYTGSGYKYTFYEKYEIEQDKQWAAAYRLFLMNGLLKVYFMRKMSKTIQHPPYTYPYEVIQYPDHVFPVTTADELFSRPYDICFIGNTATPRENICNGLSKHFKCDFVLGQPRIEHNDWLNRHRQSKLFIECGGGGASGGGFNSERSYQLITISPMLKVIDEQLLLHEWTNGINCLKASEPPIEIEIDFIKTVLKDKEWLHTVYINGVNYMKENYSAESRSNYISSILKQEGIC